MSLFFPLRYLEAIKKNHDSVYGTFLWFDLLHFSREK